MKGDLIRFTVSDLHAISESLKYGMERIHNYPHQDAEHKRASLEPLRQARQKVTEALKDIRAKSKRKVRP